MYDMKKQLASMALTLRNVSVLDTKASAHGTSKQHAAALASRHFRISRAFLHLAAPWALHATLYCNHFSLTFLLTSDRQLRRQPDAHGQVSAEQPPGEQLAAAVGMM